MEEKYILLAGRAGTGKTQMLIAYANFYPATTLILSEESTKERLIKLGLDKKVDVVDLDNFNISKISKYETICIDYVELFDEEYLKDLMMKLMKANIRIIAVTHMRAKSYEIKNIFQEFAK